jgi:hypothetical protein
MDNVQNCDSYINIPSSQTYRSYSYYIHDKIHLNSIDRFHLGFPRDIITWVPPLSSRPTLLNLAMKLSELQQQFLCRYINTHRARNWHLATGESIRQQAMIAYAYRDLHYGKRTQHINDASGYRERYSCKIRCTPENYVQVTAQHEISPIKI